MNEALGKHILGSFQEAMESLKNSVLMMASLTERDLENATRGLFERDEDYCNIAIADDEEIDLLEMDVDRDGIAVIMRFQPVASDLRTVITSMKLSVNLERIADQCVSIARRGKKLSTLDPLEELTLLRPMFDHTTAMFRDAIRTYADGNLELARNLKPRDRELDQMNRDLAERLTSRIQETPSLSKPLLELIFIARNLERIGDHATNIAEDAVYAFAAEDIRHAAKPA